MNQLNHWIKSLSFIFIIIIVFISGYYVGKTNRSQITSTTFYAEITSINDSVILVSGLDINDINHQGEFYITVDEDTPLTWRGTDISITDLKENALIAITYSGYILEVYPAQIQNVETICLLDDTL